MCCERAKYGHFFDCLKRIIYYMWYGSLLNESELRENKQKNHKLIQIRSEK